MRVRNKNFKHNPQIVTPTNTSPPSSIVASTSTSDTINNTLPECSKKNLITRLNKKNRLSSDNLTILREHVPGIIPKIDHQEWASIIDLLIQPRQIPVYDTPNPQEERKIVATASFTWLEMVHYLKKQEHSTHPIPPIKIELFGSKLPFLLPIFAEKIAKILVDDHTYRFPSDILSEYKGHPADTDYLLSLSLPSIQHSSIEHFHNSKHHFINFIAQKACLHSPSIDVDIMKRLVEKTSFSKLNIPQAIFADIFALFSLKDACTNEISEFVISQKRNEFAFLQDDLSLSLDPIIEAFSKDLFNGPPIPPEKMQEILAKTKQKILENIKKGTLALPTVISKENDLHQVFFDLMMGNLTLPQTASDTQDRWMRLIQKCSIGKSASLDLDKLAFTNLTNIANHWPNNQFSLSSVLREKLSQLNHKDPKILYNQRLAIIAASQFERHLKTHPQEFDGLISMLWHASSSLLQNGYENAIPMLWSSMQTHIESVQKQKKSPLWKMIAEIMTTSPNDFQELKQLLQNHALLSLSTDTNKFPHIAFTICQGMPACKISGGKYSLILPTLPSIDYVKLIDCSARQLIEKDSLDWKLMTLEVINMCSHASEQSSWKIIKPLMPELLDTIQDPHSAIQLIEKVVKYQDRIVFPLFIQNISPHLLWANILLKNPIDKDDIDVIKAYNLWKTHRDENSSTRNFDLEWQIIKEIAVQKPYLAIPLFCLLEESGCSNQEHAEVIPWILSLIQNDQEARELFLSLTTETYQQACIDFVLKQEKCNFQHLDWLFKLFKPSLEISKTLFLTKISHQLLDFAIKQFEGDKEIPKNEEFDPNTLSYICECAIKLNLLPQAEKIISQLLQINANRSKLAHLIASYLNVVNHGEQIKILDNHAIVEILLNAPEQAKKALLHIQNLKKADPSDTTQKQALRIYLLICHDSPSTNEDYQACFPLIRQILQDNTRPSPALKMSIQNCHKNFLDTALAQTTEANSLDFCSLFFDFLNKQIVGKITQKHVLPILQHLDNEKIEQEFTTHQATLLPLLPAENLEEKLKEKVLDYIRSPNIASLKSLCQIIGKTEFSLEEFFPQISFRDEKIEGTQVQEILKTFAKHIYDNRQLLRSPPNYMAIAINTWENLKKELYHQFPESAYPYIHEDLLVHTLSGDLNKISTTIQSLGKLLEEDLSVLKKENFLSSHITSVIEMNDAQWKIYCDYLVPKCVNFLEKIKFKKAYKSEHHLIYDFLRSLCGALSRDKKDHLYSAFSKSNKASGIACALILFELKYIELGSKDPLDNINDFEKSLLMKACKIYQKQTSDQISSLLHAVRRASGYKIASKLLSYILIVSKNFPTQIVHSFCNIKKDSEIEKELIRNLKIEIKNKLYKEWVIELKFNGDFESELENNTELKNRMDLELDQKIAETESKRYFTLLQEIIEHNCNDLLNFTNTFIALSDDLFKKPVSKEIKKDFKKFATRIILGEMKNFYFDDPDRDIYEEFIKPMSTLFDKYFSNSNIKFIILFILNFENKLTWYERICVTPQSPHYNDTFLGLENMLTALTKISSPSSYVNFRRAADILKNSFVYFFKNDHQKYLTYLKYVNSLTSMLEATTNTPNLFQRMGTILIDLYCIGGNEADKTITAQDAEARDKAISTFTTKLKKMKSPHTKELLQKLSTASFH